MTFMQAAFAGSGETTMSSTFPEGSTSRTARIVSARAVADPAAMTRVTATHDETATATRCEGRNTRANARKIAAPIVNVAAAPVVTILTRQASASPAMRTSESSTRAARFVVAATSAGTDTTQ